MIKAVLAMYWKWRINKNQVVFNDLLQLKKDCLGYTNLEEQVDDQIYKIQHLINQAEIQLLKCETSVA